MQIDWAIEDNEDEKETLCFWCLEIKKCPYIEKQSDGRPAHPLCEDCAKPRCAEWGNFVQIFDSTIAPKAIMKKLVNIVILNGLEKLLTTGKNAPARYNKPLYPRLNKIEITPIPYIFKISSKVNPLVLKTKTKNK